MKTPLQELMEYMEQNQYFIGNDLLEKYKELIEKEKQKFISLEYNHMQYQINSINENMKEDQNYMRVVDEVIYNWVMENGKEPNHIVMHPNTWQYFVSSLAFEGYFHPEVTQESKYRGYKLFRSFDVEENKFEIG